MTPENSDTYVRYEEGESPLVLSMPHSAIQVPKDLSGPIADVFKFGDEDAERTIRAGADQSVPKITGFQNQLRHSRVWTKLPRALVDVNRGIEDVDENSVEGQGKEGRAHGLIWHQSLERKGDDPFELLKRPYTHKEYQEILERHYNPYRQAVRAAMDTVLEKHGYAILIDCHTMPAVNLEATPAGAYTYTGPAKRGEKFPEEWPDLVLITNEGESCSSVISNIVRKTFKDAGLIVMDGTGPFKGDKGSTVLYADPEEGRHVVGLEFVAHNGLEFGREQGCVDINNIVAHQVRQVFTDMFAELESNSSQTS
ncbi:N-formylglutamate amidohydrolase [Patescibacteria group bacterium]